jgi:hypothetical protein
MRARACTSLFCVFLLVVLVLVLRRRIERRFRRDTAALRSCLLELVDLGAEQVMDPATVAKQEGAA